MSDRLEPLDPSSVQRGDFNGDGQQDYLVDHGGFRCVDTGSMYCGSAGCSWSAYVSQPGGRFREVDMANSYDREIVRIGNRDVIDTSHHGASPAQVVGARYVWNGTGFTAQRRR